MRSRRRHPTFAATDSSNPPARSVRQRHRWHRRWLVPPFTASLRPTRRNIIARDPRHLRAWPRRARDQLTKQAQRATALLLPAGAAVAEPRRDRVARDGYTLATPTRY